MRENILVVVFIILMTSMNLTLSDEIECGFGSSIFSNDYNCEIKSINQNSGRQNSIRGAHQTWKTDNYVENIWYRGPIDSKTDLTRFDSIFCQKFPNLEEINFLRLVPASIDENAFQNCNSLVKLYLEYAGIQSLNPAWFESLENLEVLELDGNNIRELPRGIFAPLINLNTLSLDSNQLTVIHANSFGVHNKLKEIDLDNNTLKAIDEEFLDILIASRAFGMGQYDGIYARGNECVNAQTRFESELKQKFARCIKNYQSRPDFTPAVTQPQQLQQQQLNCGMSKAVQGNIIGGTYIKPNSFPWHAALYKGENYRCGGTLVTERKVITAAHCIQDKAEPKALRPQDMNVLLGAHNLSNHLETGRNSMPIRYINMHDNWNPNDRHYDFDIAVVVLSRPVHFDKFIQPICLIPPQNTILRNSITFGYVVGYGYSEIAHPHEDVPRMILSPITSYSDCIKLFPLLAISGNGRSFCGGTADGVSGVCGGDSGGGLYLKYSQRYYLRGIVSSSLIGGDQMCGEDAYSMFTDVLFYRKWIDEIEVD